jgi:hypothetical protein
MFFHPLPVDEVLEMMASFYSHDREIHLSNFSIILKAIDENRLRKIIFRFFILFISVLFLFFYATLSCFSYRKECRFLSVTVCHYTI